MCTITRILEEGSRTGQLRTTLGLRRPAPKDAKRRSNARTNAAGGAHSRAELRSPSSATRLF